MKKILTLSALLLAGSTLMAQAPNTLTSKEKKEGWKLLFDGKTTQGWHSYLEPSAGAAWTAKDGVLQLDAATKEAGATW
jgi:hypothetical protein